MTEFAKYIREKRKEKNLSLKEVARRGGFSHSYLSQLENSKRNPKPELLRKLAIGLNEPYMSLMEKAGFSETPHYDSLIDVFTDNSKRNRREITVSLPSRRITKHEGLTAFGTFSEEELKRRLFDLKYLLEMDVDLYYNEKNLSKEEKKKISDMLQILLEKE